MPNRDYWQERMEALEDANHQKGRAYTANVEKQFRMAQKNIEDKINYWYVRMAENNELTMQGAKRLLRADELEEFKWSVEEYIEKGKSLQYSDKWAKQLENASAKVHINRLEALKMQMQQECEVLFGNMADGLDSTLRDMYTNSYYHTAYEMMKGHGVGWAFNRLDTRRIETAINTVWTNDGKRFSDRVWANKDKLVNELNTVLTQNIIRGESPQRAIQQLSHRLKVSRSNAGRLIMTESAFIHSQAQRECFKELDVERFEFVATLDSHTSEVCQAMDGVIIDMTDYKIGLNVPPLHCYCRSCIVPFYEDNVGMRAARGDDGKTYLVPSDMAYKDWKKAFVDGDTKNVRGIDDVNADIAKVQVDMTKIDADIIAKKAEFDKAELDWLNDFTNPELTAKIDIINKDLDMLTKKKDELTAKMKNLQDELALLQPKLQKLEESVKITPKEEFLKKLEDAKTVSEVNDVANEYFGAKDCKLSHVDLTDIELEAAKYNVRVLDDLTDRFDTHLVSVKSSNRLSRNIAGQCTPTSDSMYECIANDSIDYLVSNIELNSDDLKTVKAIQETFKDSHRSRSPISSVAHATSSDDKYAGVTTLIHEFGHSIIPGKASINMRKAGFKYDAFEECEKVFKKYKKEVNKLRDKINDTRMQFAGQEDGLAKGIEAAKELQKQLDDMMISNYSMDSVGEFIAEAFCDVETNSNAKKYAREAYDIIVKYFGRSGLND